MRLSLMNENRDRETNKVIGSSFWAGRAWLNLNDNYGNRKQQIGAEWYFGAHAHHTSFEMKTDFVNERELHFSIGLWHVFCFYLIFGFPFFPSWSYQHGDRQIGIRIFDGAIWLDFWRNDDGWHSRDSWWKRRELVIRPMRLLLGEWEHHEYELSSHEVNITLPDGTYPARIQMVMSEWARPRGVFVKRIKRAHIELKKPIPVPGKGENSWDLDDDAIQSMTCPANTPEEAVAAVVKSALRDRRRYGGSLDWKPEA